jgi:methyl-galactoside transport system substrate-binding protein
VLFRSVQSGNWATAPAKDNMDAWIGRFGTKMEMVMSNNDGMILGAYESLQGAGWFANDPAKQMLIIGHDAIPEVQPLIANGTFYGCILQNPVDEGRAAMLMATNLVTGKKVTDGLGLPLGPMKDYRAPFIPITKSNLNVAVDIYKKALGK